MLGGAMGRKASPGYFPGPDAEAIISPYHSGNIGLFLGKIKEAFDANPTLSNLLLAPYFAQAVEASQAAWRRVVATATELGIPVPTMAAALAFFDGYRRARLPANLLQAQRDYFGAHTYERIDRPRGQFFHTNWTGMGGNVTAETYQA